MAYNGSIELISGITQKNGGNYSLVNASAVYVDDSTRLDQKLSQLTTKINTFVPYTVTVVDELPQGAGQDRTFYLVKRPSGKYDKWWYVTNELGQKVWDSFGGSSTAVVTNLPEDPDEDTDYILASNGEYKYYKWIDNEWALIAGSSSEVIDLEDNNISLDIIGHDVPTIDTFEPSNYTNKYYLKDDSMSLYYCDGSEWILRNECLVTNPSDSKDYYILNESDIWCHYRYIDGIFEQIGGGGGYSKSEIDSLITGINTKLNKNISDVGRLDTGIQQVSTNLGILQQQVSNIDTTGYEYHASYDVETYEFKLTKEKNGVVENVNTFKIQGGGGGGGQVSTLNVIRITKSPLIVTLTDQVILEYRFESKDANGTSLMGEYIWRNNNNVIATGSCIQDAINQFDVTSYCVGTQRFTLTVRDELGNETNIVFEVQRKEVNVTSQFDDTFPIPIDESVSVDYTPIGNLNKTIHFKFDDVESTIQTADSYILKSYYIPPQSHGAHLLKIWATAEINTIQVSSEPIYKDIIWFDENNPNAVIGCPYRYDYHGSLSVRQYDSISIPFTVYDPTTNFPVVHKYVDNELIDTDTLRDGNSTSWNFKSGTIGTHTLKLVCRDTTVIIVVNVERLTIDVQPVTGNLEVDFNPSGITNNSNNRIWHNDKYHMTLSDDFDWANGGYKTDENGDDYFLIKSGNYVDLDYYFFPNSNSNYVPSKRGAEMKIIFKIEKTQQYTGTWFTNVETFRGPAPFDLPDGTREIREVDKYKGIQLGIHDGWLKTNTAPVDGQAEADSGDSGDAVLATNKYLYMPYCEEEIIELDINISPLQGTSAFMMSYEDGVPLKAFVYTNGDELYQDQPKSIRIGSDVCDVRLYRLKIYSTSLSSEGIMRNFIADSRNSTTMLERYDRNSIYWHSTTQEYSPYKGSTGELDPVRLSKKIPDVKVLILETDSFTKSKKDFHPSSLRCIHAVGGKQYPADEFYDNWYYENGYHSGQGTTSDRYGDSGRNVDFLFNCDGTHKPSDKVDSNSNYISKLTLGYGLGSNQEYVETCDDWKGDSAKISLTRNSIPNNFFNFKVNIASSENVNNALLQRRCNYYNPYLNPAKRRDPRIKNTMEFVPAILFIREKNENIDSHTEFLDTELHFYALGNLGDSKKTDYTRAYYPDDMNEFTIEVSDNDMNNAIFQSGVFLNENGERQIERFEIVQKEQDGEIVTLYSSIDKPTSYVYPVTLEEWNNETNMRYFCLYNEGFDGDHSFEERYACCGDYRDGKIVNDTHGGTDKAQIKKNEEVFRAFYRWVVTSSDEEFVNEFEEWCVKDAIIFFYVFTLNYTMMDNRAKNTFWHFAKTGEFRKSSKPVKELLHIYCELVNGEYVPTNDTEIIEGKEYYTEYAFDFWDYDNDTAIGINNNGELIFPFGKEDTDNNIDGDPSSGWVFNGALSGFWCRVKDLFRSDISSMFNQNNECFSPSGLIKEFDDFQNCFPEEIWRLDYERKYVRPFTGLSVDNSKPKQATSYLQARMQGRKKYQRRQWIRDQEFYLGTKFIGGVVNDDTIILRGYFPGNNIPVPADYHLNIVPYCDMYVYATFGEGFPHYERAKAGQEITVQFYTDTSKDTMIVVYGASRISKISDMSSCYPYTAEFGKAHKLKELVIGNDTEGFRNVRFNSLSLSSSGLLERLVLTNCISFSGLLDLQNSANLKELYADGTSINGVLFAPNAKVQTAHLPGTVTLLQMINLNYLTDFQCPLDYLYSLTLQGGIMNNIQLITETIDTLSNLRLYDIDWLLPDTTLLNQMLPHDSIAGSRPLSSLVTGTVEITGSYRQYEITQYNDAWPDLEINVNPENMVTQYAIRYLNIDKNNTVLYIAYVDSGAFPPDPYADGLIEKPILADTDQYTYKFGAEEDGEYIQGSGWNTISTIVTRNRDVFAVFTPTIKTYTVSWYERPGVLLKQLTGIEYGQEVVYDGDIPTRNDGVDILRYYLFIGWDKSTGFVTDNLDVYAIWDVGELPPDGTKMWNMTPAQLYAIGEQNRQDDYWNNADYVDIKLGHDFNFSNTISYEIGVDTLLDGIKRDYLFHEGYYFDRTKALSTDIQLLTEGDDEFTMVVDFQFNATNNSETLLSCNDGNTTNGIRIYYQNSYIYLGWGNTYIQIGYLDQRDIVVLRHKKNSNLLSVYMTFNYGMGGDRINLYDDNIVTTVISSTTTVRTNEPLSFGGVHYKNQSNEYQFLGKGTLHWCKIWKNDLGDEVCKKLASWPREWIRMYYWGKNKYLYANSDTYSPCKASFVSSAPIGGFRGRNHRYNFTNTKLVSWDDSDMREFLNNRLYNAFSDEWQSLIKCVQIKAGHSDVDSVGNRVVSVRTTNDKIYLQGYSEYQQTVNTISDYNDEWGIGDPPIIPWTTTQNVTVNGQTSQLWLSARFRGLFRSLNVNDVIPSLSDPALRLSHIETGTVWHNTTNNQDYIFIDKDLFEEYISDTVFNTTVTNMPFIRAYPDNGVEGVWELSERYTLRSPYRVTNYVMYITWRGTREITSTQSNNWPVVPSFSF